MTTKVQRQGAVAQLIADHDVTSHTQLVSLLKKSGIIATQATVSRDLEEIGAVKVRTSHGETAYAIPEFEPDRIAPLEQLRRVLAEWVADIQISEPIVIIRTPPGCAHVVASALDRSRIEGLAGTVAGDDTIFCIASEEIGGAKMADKLRELAGISTNSKVRKVS